MTRMSENTRGKLMMAHGLAMLTLGFALFYIRATMTNLFFYVFGGAFALMLVAASLLFIAVVDWICAAGLGCHQVSRLRGLLFLSTAVAACSVFLIVFPGATMQLLCYVIAVYALALGVGKLGLAPVVERHAARKKGDVSSGGPRVRFQCVPGCGRDYGPGRSSLSGCRWRLRSIHGLPDAAYYVLSATTGAETYQAGFRSQASESVRPQDHQLCVGPTGITTSVRAGRGNQTLSLSISVEAYQEE